MAILKSTQSDVDLAMAVSLLLNKNNRLTVVHTPHTILNSTTKYLVLFGHPPENNVIGCVGVQEQQGVSVIKHLSVSEFDRGKGYGRHLLQAALNNCLSQTIRAFIRSDNAPSLMLFERFGFMAVGIKQVNDQYSLVAVEKKA